MDTKIEKLYKIEAIQEETEFPLDINNLAKSQNEELQNNEKFQKLFKNHKEFSIQKLQEKILFF